MKYLTVIIAMLFFALAVKAEEIHINNYFRLISDVHKYYDTFSIIFVRSKACDFDMTTLLYAWSRDFSRQRVMTATITFSELMNEYNEYQKNIPRPLFVVLLDTGKTMDEFVEVTRSVKPISFPAWLIVFLQRPGKPLEKYCRHPADNMFNVDFNTRMLVLCYDHPSLIEWYAIRDNRTRTFELATWTADGSLSFRTQKRLYARRSDMFGDLIRVASVHDSPFFSLKNGMISGFLGLLLIELSKVMNFTIEFLDQVDDYGTWNHQDKMWTGVIGQLVNDKADIGISGFTITECRLSVVDFTIPLIHTPSRVYFKQPDGADMRWSGYFKAFSRGIWIMLAAVIIIASILLSIIKGYFSMNLIFENYIHVWGIYCQQSLSEFPNKLSMRLAIFSIYVSSFVIIAAYSASLISFLTLTKFSLPFSTLEGYIEDGSYKLIVMKNSAEDDFVNRVKTPVFMKMYKLLEDRKHLPFTVLDGFKQICERKNLGFYTTDAFKIATNIYLTCKITSIESGITDNLAMALTKGNPYTGLINYHLRRFQLNGVINKLKTNQLFKNNDLETNFNVVNFGDIAPTLTIMIGGTVLALFILIIEKMCYSFHTRFKKSNKWKNRDEFLVQNYKSKAVRRF